MYPLKSAKKFDFEKAKRFAFERSDNHCYLYNENALSFVMNERKMIIDFDKSIIYHESQSIHNAVALKKAIEID